MTPLRITAGAATILLLIAATAWLIPTRGCTLETPTHLVTANPLDFTTPPPPTPVPPADRRLPGPARAKAAATRVTPELTAALQTAGLHLGDPVFLRAFKEEKQLELWIRHRDTKKYQHFRTWPIAAQSGTLGPKLAEGDRQVPEGFYHVPPSAMKPDSQYHLAFNIGYPNAYDRHHSRTGSFIMVHGSTASIGCLAMTDPRIEEIYTLCAAAHQNGQPYFRIHIFPFRMTETRLARETQNPSHPFWQNLKQGHDHFQNTHIPPETTVKNGQYTFSTPPAP